MKRDSFKSAQKKALKNGGVLSPPAGGDNAPSSFGAAAQARLEANLGKSPFATGNTGKIDTASKPPSSVKPRMKKAKW